MFTRINPRRLIFLIPAFLITAFVWHAFLPSTPTLEAGASSPWPWSRGDPPAQNALTPEPEARKSVTFVVASQRQDDTTWLENAFPDWEKAIYQTDGSSRLKVPANKGRESMVYLTYIIDNYATLPPISIFHHATRYQWHNDDPLYDGLRLLSRLRLSHIRTFGYANLRCVWTLGCPAEIHPLTEEADPTMAPSERNAGSFYAQAFRELFPGNPVPADVGASCCAQFAATREKIREKPLSEYERYRDWLLETELPDAISGRILEYSWHMIMGQDSVSCPNAKECYCDTYDICDLSCETDGTCRSQYTLPKYSSLPNGWPDFDWDGKWRNITQLREEQERVWDLNAVHRDV